MHRYFYDPASRQAEALPPDDGEAALLDSLKEDPSLLPPGQAAPLTEEPAPYALAEAGGENAPAAPPVFPAAPPVPPPPEAGAGRRKGPRSPRRRPWVGFLLSLTLVLALGAAAVLSGTRTSSFHRHMFPDAPPSGDHGGEDDGFSFPFPLPTEDQAETSILRAPTDPGVTLPLQTVHGEILSLQALYQKCLPSIVGIRAHLSDGSGATGTGIVMTEDGYIITNYHVIQGAKRAEVVFQDGALFPARLVGGDQTSDLAVLKIAANGLTPAEFGDSDALQVGDAALAIGNPLGEELQGTMTDGIISAIERDVNVDGNTMTLIQTTAALNSGNSGGALLNIYGQVVGVTNMKMMSYYDTIEGLGFAIPTVSAKTVVDELLAYGHVRGRPTLGITAYSVTSEDAGEDMEPGVYISTVTPGSGAEEAGLQPGDIITHCNGKAVTTVDEINAAKEGLEAGDSLHFRVLRDGERFEVDVVLVERYQLDT